MGGHSALLPVELHSAVMHLFTPISSTAVVDNMKNLSLINGNLGSNLISVENSLLFSAINYVFSKQSANISLWLSCCLGCSSCPLISKPHNLALVCIHSYERVISNMYGMSPRVVWYLCVCHRKTHITFCVFSARLIVLGIDWENSIFFFLLATQCYICNG